MRRLTKALTLTAAGAAVSLVAACSGGSGASGAGGGDGQLGQFRYLVPNSAGSGWDTTARTAAKIMEDDGLATRIDVFNVDGANGTVGLSRLVDEKANGELVMQMGFGLVAATVSQNSPVTFADTTPIVKLLDEYLAVVVPGNSPINNYDDLAAAWKANHRLNVGGVRRSAALTTSPPCRSPRPTASRGRTSTTSPSAAAASCPRSWAARWTPPSPVPPTSSSR